MASSGAIPIRRWNPNVPFHGTQEKWWEHFHRIEEGEFYPVAEVYQRISEWIYNQKEVVSFDEANQEEFKLNAKNTLTLVRMTIEQKLM